MEFEIDVSGGDILGKHYTIVVADKNNLVKGFKINDEILKTINSRRGEEKYRYALSKQGKTLFRVRLYCIIVYYLIKDIKLGNKKEISLEICKDFQGHEKDITSNLKEFLEKKLKLKVDFRYARLPKGSNADKYAYIMRKDTKNKLNGYVKIELKDIEKLLKRK